MRLERQKVLITGGTAGIGRAVAVALLQRENEVMVCARGEHVQIRNKVLGLMRHADRFGAIVQDGMA